MLDATDVEAQTELHNSRQTGVIPSIWKCIAVSHFMFHVYKIVYIKVQVYYIYMY